jgi:hypothetical protein
MPLPAHKRPAIDRSLLAAFGTKTLDAVTPVSGGLSGAGVYRIEIGGGAYLLRLDGARDGLRDPVRSHACMKIAAEAGLAPRVLHADAEAGVTITDFVVAQPPTISRAELIAQLGRMVRALHDTPAFPPLVDYLDGLDSLADSALGSGLPAAGTIAEARAVQAALSTAYRRLTPQLVSSHNDGDWRRSAISSTALALTWRLIFRARGDSCSSLAPSRNTSRPPLKSRVRRAALLMRSLKV